ncbi:DNA primase [Nitrolancea hollandica]|uniref:Toprim domain-containing protein n=1 Tax=Nitrolancea hollandica Lb TaxID=1129897 RepID=I4EL75_9BACT|nr:DNA primase [Nitrolancea hollandica]CCF85437.1 hypothetical protein NITHO_4990002 [Nitrolancea hollandica Lb]
MGSIDTERLKQEHPIAEVIAGYGIALRPRGRTLVGRCPFHADGGRPNLTVYPDSRSWYCFRCGVGGDVIRFIEQIEGIGFRAAVARLADNRLVPADIRPRRDRAPKTRRRRMIAMGRAERECLSAAVALYHNRLLTEPAALAYLERRGLDRATLECCRVGYANGDELAAYLAWRRLPVQAALRAGLIGRDGREFLAERVVVPEIRAGQPLWLVGRTIDPEDDRTKYLGLPGRKRLFGWDAVSSDRAVILVEGVLDWLTLQRWGFPALALVGTHVTAAALNALTRFERVTLVLDNDDAGRAATANLIQRLGSRAMPVALSGVKDVADLAPQRDGRDIFIRALQQSELASAA